MNELLKRIVLSSVVLAFVPYATAPVEASTSKTQKHKKHKKQKRELKRQQREQAAANTTP